MTDNRQADINPTVRDNGRDELFEKQRRRSNLIYRIISLICAFLVWLYVAGNEAVDFERPFSGIPVAFTGTEIMKANYGLSVLTNSSFDVDILVSGKKSEVNKLKNSDIEAYVDFSQVTMPGEVSLPIQVKQEGSLTAVPQTDSIIVMVDFIKSKSVNVEVKPRYNTDTGVTLETSVSPSSIMLSGAGEALDMVEKALINLNLGTVSGPRTVRESIVLVDKDENIINNPYIKANYTEGTVNVTLSAQKQLPLMVKYKYGYFTPQTVNTTVTPATVNVKGSPEALNAMTEIALEIDETKIENDTDLTVDIPLPEGIQSIDSVTALVSIDLTDNETKSLTINSFKVKAPPAGTKYHIEDNQVVIKFRGPLKDLSKLSVMDVTVSVDLSKYGDKGTYSKVPVEITVTNYPMVYAVGDYSVTAKIE